MEKIKLKTWGTELKKITNQKELNNKIFYNLLWGNQKKTFY